MFDQYTDYGIPTLCRNKCSISFWIIWKAEQIAFVHKLTLFVSKLIHFINLTHATYIQIEALLFAHVCKIKKIAVMRLLPEPTSSSSWRYDYRFLNARSVHLPRVYWRPQLKNGLEGCSLQRTLLLQTDIKAWPELAMSFGQTKEFSSTVIWSDETQVEDIFIIKFKEFRREKAIRLFLFISFSLSLSLVKLKAQYNYSDKWILMLHIIYSFEYAIRKHVSQSLRQNSFTVEINFLFTDW